MSDRVADGADLIAMLNEMVTHGSQIYVRHADQEGKFKNSPISELTATQAMAFMVTCVGRWMDDPGYRPFRLLTDEEKAAKEKR